MKKIWLFLGIAVIFGAAAWFFAAGYDYKKIVFVLPSSERASSPYYYKKDGDFFLAQDLRKGLEKLGYTVEYRFREAARLGFTTAVVPTLRREIAIPGLSIVQVDTLQDALGAMLR